MAHVPGHRTVAMFFDPPPSREPALWERLLFGTLGAVLLFTLYALVGLHHAPWLGEDLRHLWSAWAVAHGQLIPDALTHPDLIPWGPLYGWSAALLGSLAEVVGVPFHDGSRLATPLWLAVQTLLVTDAVRRIAGRNGAIVAAIAAATPLGWLIFGHLHSSVAAVSAAVAWLLWGSVAIEARSLRLLHGLIGATLLFWSSGIPGLILALGALPLILRRAAVVPRTSTLSPGLAAYPDFLTQTTPPSLPNSRCLLAWFAASVAALLVLATAALLLLLPDAVAWARATFDTVALDPRRGFDALRSRGGWTLWPLWLVVFWPNRLYELWRLPEVAPIALWLLWLLLATLVLFPVSESTLLLLTAPLAWVATVRLLRFGPSTSAAFASFTLAMTLVLLVLVALVTSAQLLDWPPGLARYVARVAPDFRLDAGPVRLTAAAAGLLLWVLLIKHLPRQAVRAAAHWLLSVVLIWWLTVLLLFPWIDAARDLAPTVRTLWHHPVVAAHQCLAPHPRMGADVVAALSYYAPAQGRIAADCPLVTVRLKARALDPAWRRWIIAQAVRGSGNRTEWWIVVPLSAPPLAALKQSDEEETP